MTYSKWTHRYNWKMLSPRHIPRIGYELTGTTQVGREYTHLEIEKLVKKMNHGTIDDAELIEFKLIEVRNNHD